MRGKAETNILFETSHMTQAGDGPDCHSGHPLGSESVVTSNGSWNPTNLTIAIPTYNRPEPLTRTVRKLIPQLTTRCRLLIVDNASEPPVIDTLSPLLAEYDNPLVRVVRNKTNIGANANILRCMELCDTEWVWILGDDDRIWDDAVEKILKGIDDHPTCMCLSFAQTSHPRNESSITHGRTELLEVLGRHFYTLLLISTSIYRVEAILPSITYGYMQIPSCAPHLAVLLMAVKDTGTVYFSVKTIVEYIPAQKGSGSSQFWIERGFPLLLDLPLNARDRDLLRKALRSRTKFSGILAAYVDALCYGLRTHDLAVCAQLYRMYALRRATFFRSPVEWFFIRCLLTTLLSPRLAILAMRSVFWVVRRQTLEERAACVGLSLDDRV
jgi:glycosyltransferase involved in cell wall biosynthesis